MGWLGFWEALTGIGTLALAGATVAVICQTQRQARKTERQHRERFKPICVLAPYDGVDPWNGRQALIETTPPTQQNPAFGTVAIRCVLRNVGCGPAMNLRLSFRSLARNGWQSDPWELSPLGTGESRGGIDAPLTIPLRLHERFNDADLQSLPGELWEIWLEYEDVFGQAVHSIHRKALFDPAPATFEWVADSPDKRPRAMVRPIPWLTYSARPVP
jgi:hypothetical protein